MRVSPESLLSVYTTVRVSVNQWSRVTVNQWSRVTQSVESSSRLSTIFPYSSYDIVIVTNLVFLLLTPEPCETYVRKLSCLGEFSRVVLKPLVSGRVVTFHSQFHSNGEQARVRRRAPSRKSCEFIHMGLAAASFLNPNSYFGCFSALRLQPCTCLQASKLSSRNTQVPKPAQPNTPVANGVGKGGRRGREICPGPLTLACLLACLHVSLETT